jgi:hypothetical protein
MDNKDRKKPIYLGDPLLKLLASRPESEGLSTRINEVAARYLSIMRHASPQLAAPEWDLLMEATGTWIAKSEDIPHLWMSVDDAIRLEGLADKYKVDGIALVSRLKDYSVAELTAMVERMELYRAAQD